MNNALKIIGVAGLIALWGCEKPFVTEADSESGISARHGGKPGKPDAGKPGKQQIQGQCPTQGITTLYAGQHIEVGYVDVVEVEGQLHVTLNTENGWGLHEVHVAVALTPDALPGPPGLMPYQATGLNGVTQYGFTIDLSEIGYDYESPLYIVTHAVVEHPEEGNETAWGFGTPYGVGWAWYFRFPGTDCDTPVTPPVPDDVPEVPPITEDGPSEPTD